MPIGLVAGCAGGPANLRARAVQLFNAIPQAQRANWRIFYFDNTGVIHEYTTTKFNNTATVAVATETHCVFYGHGGYDPAKGDRSTGLSYWDVNANTANFNTALYTAWLAGIGVGITTVTVAACNAGNNGTGGAGLIPIQHIVAVRPGAINAIGPNTSLQGLNGVNLNWPAATPAGWTQF